MLNRLGAVREESDSVYQPLGRFLMSLKTHTDNIVKQPLVCVLFFCAFA